ncbi:uncharacterized protein N7446_011569 [Penicillium canescens]|uniref:uncharacterized protein n=1 Tax=Penicillium canescens TaxID=5083 RepID=UPI0026E0AC8E|nr:uncharacterized protein N7446_011569 [Penicillium canescens]KAJ6048886.1 hypothetical protein N7446_011569 [Penicillium canescens]
MAALFSSTITTQLEFMGLQPKTGDFVARNSTRTEGRACSKETDWWFGPYDNRRAIVGTPSLVLEVGESESSKKTEAMLSGGIQILGRHPVYTSM